MSKTNILKFFGLLSMMIISLFSCKKKQLVPLIKDDQALAGALKELCAKYKQPAMGAALIIGEKIIAKASVGNTLFGETIPVYLESRFHIGSTTKTMTALLIAILVDEGKLRWDMTLKKTLPGITMLPDYHSVTLHDLLLSKAGIIPFQDISFEDSSVVEKLWKEISGHYNKPKEQRLELAKVVLNIPPIAPPGKNAVYSNVGWAIVGLIAEVAANSTYEDLLKEKIFDPLGMKNTKIGRWPASKTEPDQPRGHYSKEGVYKGSSQNEKPVAQQLDDEYVFPDWMNPSGGVHCSIEDYGLYARENLLGLQGKGILLDKTGYSTIHTIQNVCSLKEMFSYSEIFTNIKKDVKVTMGYGWSVIPDGKDLISGSDGSGGTFFARLVIYPPLNVAFAGFTNCGNGNSALDEVIERISGFKWNTSM